MLKMRDSTYQWVSCFPMERFSNRLPLNKNLFQEEENVNNTSVEETPTDGEPATEGETKEEVAEDKVSNLTKIYDVLFTRYSIQEPVEEEVKTLTLDEWKAQQKKEGPKFNTRKAGEGSDIDPKWKKATSYKKVNEEQSDEEEEEAVNTWIKL